MGVIVLFFATGMARATSRLSSFGQLMLLINLPLFLLGYYSLNGGMLLLLIAAPALSQLVLLALSRTREFDADLGAVQLIGDAAPLISAL